MKLTDTTTLCLVHKVSGERAPATVGGLATSILGGLKVEEYDLYTDANEAQEASERYKLIRDINVKLLNLTDTGLESVLRTANQWAN